MQLQKTAIMVINIPRMKKCSKETFHFQDEGVRLFFVQIKCKIYIKLHLTTSTFLLPSGPVLWCLPHLYWLLRVPFS